MMSVAVLFQNTAFMVAKTSPFGLKNPFSQCAAFLVERSGTVFLPRMMSCVAKQCVVMSWLVRELAHRHKAMTAAQKLEELRHRQRGFYGFC